jgi:hypothetical protein
MFRVRCTKGGLVLTSDLLVRDDREGLSSDVRDYSVLQKRQRFQPVDDLVIGLDNIASSSFAT